MTLYTELSQDELSLWLAKLGIKPSNSNVRQLKPIVLANRLDSSGTLNLSESFNQHIRKLQSRLISSNINFDDVEHIDLSRNSLRKADLPVILSIVKFINLKKNNVLKSISLKHNSLVRYNYNGRFDDFIVDLCENVSKFVDLRENPVCDVTINGLLKTLSKRGYLHKFIFLTKTTFQQGLWKTWCYFSNKSKQSEIEKCIYDVHKKIYTR